MPNFAKYGHTGQHHLRYLFYPNKPVFKYRVGEPWSSGYRRKPMIKRVQVRILAPHTRWIFFTFVINLCCCLKRGRGWPRVITNISRHKIMKLSIVLCTKRLLTFDKEEKKFQNVNWIHFWKREKTFLQIQKKVFVSRFRICSEIDFLKRFRSNLSTSSSRDHDPPPVTERSFKLNLDFLLLSTNSKQSSLIRLTYVCTM